MILWSLETCRHAWCLARWFVAALLVDTASAESRLQSNRHPNGLAAPPDHRDDTLSPDRPVQLFRSRRVSETTRSTRHILRTAILQETATASTAAWILSGKRLGHLSRPKHRCIKSPSGANLRTNTVEQPENTAVPSIGLEALSLLFGCALVLVWHFAGLRQPISVSILEDSGVMQTRPAENARLAEESRPPVLPSEVPIHSIMREISAFCLKVIPVAWTMALVFSRPAIAQVLPTVNVVLAQQETTASETSEVQLSLEANSRLGGLTYVPGHWGEFQLRLENGGEEDRELLCTSYFDGLPGLQYGRKFWLPAKSKLSLSHPVLIPSADQIPGASVHIRSLLVDDSQGQEVLLKNSSGQLQHDRTLLIDSTERHTGIIAGWLSNDVMPQDVVDLVVANRVYQGINNRVTYLPH